METQKETQLVRKLTPIESFFAYSPFSIVSLVARIKGPVTLPLLQSAVEKVQQRHTHLHARIIPHEGDLWLASSGVGPIPIQVFPRESEETWITIAQKDCTRPFSFDQQPVIRLLLVQGDEVSDLVIQCHHTICDGLSLAFLARDLLIYMGYPDQPVDTLPAPPPITTENIPKEAGLNAVMRFFINRINKKWAAEKVTFDQQDYLALSQAYWKKYHHRLVSVELSPPQTDALISRCRDESVTVNTALVTAFIGAQKLVLGSDSTSAMTAVAASLRDRVEPPVGEELGFYAGAILQALTYDMDVDFWENARQIHQQLVPQFNNKKLFAEAATWSALDASILPAINFKRLGEFVPEDFESYEKLTTFSQRSDAVSDMLKRNRMSSLDDLIVGSAVTNLTRLDFPTSYGDLELDRMILKPGGAFPLVTVNLVVGAVTTAGKLSLLIEYAEERIDSRTIEIIKNQAVTHLLSE